MTYIIKIFCIFINLLPETRLFKFKVTILNILGFDVSNSSRIVSSISIIGKPGLIIGRETYIGHFFKCYGTGNINIGENVDVAPEVSFITGTHEINLNGQRVAGKGMCRDIIIGNNTWICSGSKILGGTVIGDNCLIAAGSVVKGTFENNSFIGGNPARLISSISKLNKNEV